MNPGRGSQELIRLAAAYLTSVVFALTFLIGIARGVDGTTALTRGVVAASIALIAAQLLAPPVVEVVLNALARDEARRRTQVHEEED